MNKVIGEFLSSQQPHPELMAQVLFKVLSTCYVLVVPFQMTSFLGSDNVPSSRFVGSPPHVYYVPNKRLQGIFNIELKRSMIFTTCFASG